MRFLILLLMVMSGVSHASPTVLVSIPPIKFFVDQLMGNRVDVVTLVPSGANPHTYEPTPRQVAEAHQATIWFRVGELFEARIGEALRHHNADLIEVDIRDGIDLIDGHACGHKGCLASKDPHIWLSLRIDQVVAKKMAATLQVAFPDRSKEIAGNLNKLVEKLASADHHLQSVLAPVAGETILVSHPALGYFCRDYNLHQLSVEFAGKEPSPKRLANTIAKAKRSKVRLVVLQTQFNNKGAQLVAKQLGIPTCEVNPLSPNVIETVSRLASCIVSDAQ